MDGHFLQVRIVLLKLQTFGSVLFVLSSDITAHAGNTTILLLGAFQNHLHSCVFVFLCHFFILLFLTVAKRLFDEYKTLFSYAGQEEERASTIHTPCLKSGCKITTFFSIINHFY